MRKTAIFAAAAIAAMATPAMANEARVEVRGGIVWAGGNDEAIAGVAAGYDFDLGSSAFAGVEVSGDKVLVSGADVVVDTTARAGVKIGEAGKLFAAAGYSFGPGEDNPHLGAGYEHKFGSNVYGKVEYRHFFSDSTDSNTATVGLGYKF